MADFIYISPQEHLPQSVLVFRPFTRDHPLASCAERLVQVACGSRRRQSPEITLTRVRTLLGVVRLLGLAQPVSSRAHTPWSKCHEKRPVGLVTYSMQNSWSGEETASSELKPRAMREARWPCSASAPGWGVQEAWRRRSVVVGRKLSLLHGYTRHIGLRAIAYSHSGLVMAKVVF